MGNQTAVRWTYFLLVVVALAGLWLRAMPLLPGAWIGFEPLRHAHSHLAFLGWVYSAFYLALVYYFLPAGSFEQPRYRQFFWWTQATSVCMFAAFLYQGYGPLSIAFLTLHTGLAYGFFYCFFKDWKRDWQRPSTWFGLVAIGAFVLSSLGPFAIPAIQLLDGGNMRLMRMAIHFYLHFHYNGWFVFGLLAIFYKILERSGIAFHVGPARWQWGLMALGLLPAYFLFAPALESLVTDGFLFQLTAWVQWAGVALFVYQFFKMGWGKQLGSTPTGAFLLRFSVVFLLLKYSFELLAIQPVLSHLIVRGDHFLTLGYLHLLFLGSVTPFIWWFSLKEGWVVFRQPTTLWGIAIFMTGFIGSETGLFAAGLKWMPPNVVELLLLFSILMALGIVLFFCGAMSKAATITGEQG